MFVSQTPINLPVSTANLAVESIAKEASLKPQIPAAPPTNPSSNSKHSTDFSEQNKPNLLDSLIQDKTIKEQTENSSEESSNQQKDDSRSEKVKEEVSRGGRGEPELDLAEQQEVANLQSRDREVRAHEAAHASVGGSLAGSPNLNFTSGPDGKRYATSGDVSIDISKVANDPSATIAKLQQVQRAALAPAQPSSQDRKVAAIASAGISHAQVELSLERLENAKKSQQAGDRQSELKPEKQSELDSANEALNPVRALRESRALDQKIEDSGALNKEQTIGQFSLSA